MLPQSLTPPARATPSLVQELRVAFPDGRAQAGGGAPGARVSDCGRTRKAASRSTQALQRAEGVSPPAGAVDPAPRRSRGRECRPPAYVAATKQDVTVNSV